MELHNMDPDVLDELYKIASINLSPNTPGQVIRCPDHALISNIRHEPSPLLFDARKLVRAPPILTIFLVKSYANRYQSASWSTPPNLETPHTNSSLKRRTDF